MSLESNHVEVSQYASEQTETSSPLADDAIPKVREKNSSLHPNKNEELLGFPSSDEVLQGGNSVDQSESGSFKETKEGWEITQTEDRSIQLVKGDTTIQLPSGAVNLAFKDGLPSYSRNGVTVDLDGAGKPKAYHSNGFSFEHHESDKAWYYHENSGGDYVKIDVPTLNEDGSVTTKENGGLNAGREHSLTGDGQSSESLLSTKLGSMGEKIEIDKLANAIEEGSIGEAFDWVKGNAGLTTTFGIGLPSLVFDSVTGANTYDSVNAFAKGFGDTLVDGTVNGVVYLGGLVQGGAEELGLMPDLQQVDQVIPDLDLYENFDPENATTAETVAARVGQVGAFLVPFAGQAGGAIRLSKGAISAVQEGRVISTLSEGAAAFGGKIKSWLPGSANEVADISTPPVFVQSERVMPEELIAAPRELPNGQSAALNHPFTQPKSSAPAQESNYDFAPPATARSGDELSPLVVDEVPLPSSPSMQVQEVDGLIAITGRGTPDELLIPAPAREVQIGDDIFQLTKRNIEQKWLYGGRGRGGDSPIKLHVETDGPEDLARLQEVLIPALRRDPELTKLVGDWKTFDPLHSVSSSRAIGSPPSGYMQDAKAFTIYPENAADASRIQQRLDEILHQNGLGREAEIATGNVDRVGGLSNRVGVVRDYYEPAIISGRPAGARLPEGLARKIESNTGHLSAEQLRSFEASAGLQSGILRYDDAGFLSLASSSSNSRISSKGQYYLTELGSGGTSGLTDRPAMYALADMLNFRLA